MLRIHWVRTFILLQLCAASIASFAVGRVIVNVDMATPNALVDLTVKDAEVSQVLTALFNATNDEYQLKTGTGIVGTIDSLQLTQKPFDDALVAVLEAADPSFSFTKQGTSLYLVTSGMGSGVSGADTATKPATVTPVADQKAAVPEKAAIKIIKAKLKPITATGATGALGGIGGIGGIGGTAATSTDTAAKECFLAMIYLRNINAGILSEAFGFSSIPAFDDVDSGGYGSGRSGRSGRSSRSGRGGSRYDDDDDYYSDNDYDSDYNSRDRNSDSDYNSRDRNYDSGSRSNRNSRNSSRNRNY